MDYNNSSRRFRFKTYGGNIGFAALRPGFTETVCHEKIVLKIKSIVIRTANNLFGKVHNCTHFKGDLISFNESAIF